MSDNAVEASPAEAKKLHVSETDVAIEIDGMNKWYGRFPCSS